MSSVQEIRGPALVPTDVSRPFWEATREGRLVMQYCPVAGKFQHFPRPVSQYTGKRNLEWRDVSGRGFVYAVTVTRRGPPLFRAAEPYLVATVQLDEGVRIMSNLVNCSVDAAFVGMRVELCWKDIEGGYKYPLFQPESERAGRQ
jgi:uncharacterized protein